MRDVRGYITVQFYAEMPDDDNEADSALDTLCDRVADVLNAADLPHAFRESWSVVDADTRPESDG